MKDKPILLNVLAFLGCLPLLINTRYVINAWAYSPMDQRDYVFLAAFLISSTAVLLFARQSKPSFQLRIALATLVFFLGFVLCKVISLNSGAIITGIMFWWTLIWYLKGWSLAYLLLPSFCTLLLASVSSTYWICVFFGISPEIVFALKVAVTIILAIITVLNIRLNWEPRQGIVIFAIAMTAAVVLLLQLGNVTDTYPALRLNFAPKVDQFIGREIDETEAFNRFFKYSDAHNYKYADDMDVFTLLMVNCGNNIHEIHPASHCLRSGGWEIESEQMIEYQIDGKPLCVTEVKGHFDYRTIILWVWYTNDKISTGNFICFRRLWRPNSNWATYQIGVDNNGDLEESRQALEKLVTALKN